jgi:tetratricopeptide (TPR) repeat protein
LIERSPAWSVAALCFYLVAVFSKEHAFLIAGMALPLYVFLERPSWKRSVMALVVSGAVLGAGAAVLLKMYPNLLGQVFDETSRHLTAQLDAQRNGAGAQVFGLSVLNQMGLFFYYGGLWLLPYVGWISIDMRPPFPVTLTAWPHILGALAYLVLVLASVIAVVRRSDVWGFVGLCLLFPLTLFWTEFSTVWIQDPMVLYRSYLWAIPIPALIAVVLTGFSAGSLYKGAVLVALVLSGLTAERVASLRDELSVWSDAIDKIDARAPANVLGRYRAFLNRGAYHLGRFSPELALEDFKFAVALGEPTGSAWMNTGVAQQLLKRHAEALQSFGRAQSAGYNAGSLYFQRGESQYALGDFAAAFDSYSASIDSPQDQSVVTQSRLRRAEAAMQLRRYALAVADFEALQAAEPSNPRYLVGLGMAQIGAGNGASALVAFNQLLATKPSALGYYGRALAKAFLGNALEAKEDLSKAVQLEPANPNFRQLLERWKSGVTLSLK